MTRPQLQPRMEKVDNTKGGNSDNYLNASQREVTQNNNVEAGEEAFKDDDNNNNVNSTGRRQTGRTKGDNNENPIVSKGGYHEIPIVTIENPTPSPHPPRENSKVDGGDVGDDAEEEEDEEDEDVDYETGEEEEIEEQEEDMEMTQEEKQAMYTCVQEGDIDALEDCLDMPNADINMTWFQENLLMAAIRAGQTEMAEFLVDNGVDHTFRTSRLVVRETPGGTMKFDRYETDCRQMAFDRDLDDLVYLLDHLQGRLFSFVPGPKRSPRMRRPPPITPTDDSNSDGELNSSDADVSDSSSHETQEDDEGNESREQNDNQENTKKKRKKKRARRKKSRSALSAETGKSYENEEEDGDRDKTARTASTFGEVDSGNYSMASSPVNKLKKNMIEKHNKLLEQEEKSEVSNLNSPRKKSLSAANSEKSKSRSPRQLEENEGDLEADEKTGTSRSREPSLLPDTSPPLPVIPHPPPDPIRRDRSDWAVDRSNTVGRFYTSPLNDSNTETPLQWRKVYTTGSYAKESKNWHCDNNYSYPTNIINSAPNSTSIECVSEVKISNAKTTTPTPTKSSSLPSVTVTPATSLPRTTSSSSSSSKSSHRSSMLSFTSSNPSNKPTTSILKTPLSPDSRSNDSSLDASAAIQERPVAGYLRPTHSTMTKQRLTPRFVDSYGGLHFHHQPERSQFFKTFNLKQNRSFDPMKPPSNMSPMLNTSNDIPKTKYNIQRRNHRTISYRV